MIPKQSRTISLHELARLAEGRVVGDGNVLLTGVASAHDAGPGQLTFLSGAKNYAAYIELLKSSKAAAVIAPEDAPDLSLPSLRLKNPYYGLVKALEFFFPAEKPDYSLHPAAFVSENAEVDASASVGPNAVVEEGAVIDAGAVICGQAYVGRNARIGSNTLIHPGVRILAGCVVGKNCIIHANAVVGSDGFGFTLHQGRQLKVPQVGNVVIEDDVEIGACVTIDRGALVSTLIGAGTKIDNMVHIAHNVQIGRNCVIVAQVGISGSTILEDEVTLAGQVGTVGHVRVGKGTTVAARGVVTSDVAPGSFVSGFPLKPHSEERKILASLRRLPDLIKKVRELEKMLEGNDKK
ncbi:MAG: UDP-3-O-(3-hydroxymyristoyl)glucosamine N-acyltransferase [Candidatus Riflebacteria bacterium HGW-Riflebacteria-2]|jgi:UDP-3-O-[3-hydroxymyristoyl] glucosamine N-acyltransferase|nr:MAG: UDP-3-O-(3-hydroxymyristoyl)glucosamine N-acyltransferase [Candidatus Riflebacteria bacterium HGW-Riflebacteria-2]